MPKTTIPRVIERVLTQHAPEAIPGFRAICNQTHWQNEHLAMIYARWVCTHGHVHGFRPPNVQERVRSTGQAAYLRDLGLSNRDLFDLTGNHFDCSAVQTIIAPLLRDWVYLREVPYWTYPSPASQAALLQDLGATVHHWDRSIPLQPAPWPADLGFFAYQHTPASPDRPGRPALNRPRDAQPLTTVPTTTRMSSGGPHRDPRAEPLAPLPPP